MSVTREQQLEALKYANEIRVRRAELKRRIKKGEVRVSSVLGREIPEWLGSMRIGELLESMHLVGHSKTYGLLARVGNVSYTRRLDRLTTRQKNDLLLLLAAREQQS